MGNIESPKSSTYLYLESIFSGEENGDNLLHATHIPEYVKDVVSGDYKGRDRKDAIRTAWNEVQWLESYGVDLKKLGIDKGRVVWLYMGTL